MSTRKCIVFILGWKRRLERMNTIVQRFNTIHEVCRRRVHVEKRTTRIGEVVFHTWASPMTGNR